MGGDPSRRNQSLYYIYHREKRHTTKQCRVFKDHLEQLVKAGHIKEFMVGQGGSMAGQISRNQGNVLPPPLGIIVVILATSISTKTSRRKGILSIIP